MNGLYSLNYVFYVPMWLISFIRGMRLLLKLVYKIV